MAEYISSEIVGVKVLETEKYDFTSSSPFEWQADAITMLAFAAAQRVIPDSLRERSVFIENAAYTVANEADEQSPLGPVQIAAAAMARRILYNLREVGALPEMPNAEFDTFR